MESTVTIESISKVGAVSNPGLPDQPARFTVKASVTLLSDSGETASAVHFLIDLPFDESATYAALESDARKAIGVLAGQVLESLQNLP